MYGLIDKIALGFTSSFGKIIKSGNIVYTMLTGLITVYIFTNYKEKLYRVISIIPFGTFLVLANFRTMFIGIFPNLSDFYELIITKDFIFTVVNCNNFYYVFPLILSMTFYICIGLSLLLIFKKISNSPALIMYLAGFMATMILAFSPTVFISRDRVMVFWDFICIAISYMIYEKMKLENKDKVKTLTVTTFIIEFAAICQYINVLVACYASQKQ